MIKIENVSIVGWEPAIRGARNPMNSWEKSDSLFDIHERDSCNHENGDYYVEDAGRNIVNKIADVPDDITIGDVTFWIGPNDLKLLTNLAKAGSDEAKFRRMIVVYVDITAPMYWWKEADTYKVGTVRNSCSTMHKIHAKEFTLEDFSTEHLINTLRLEDDDAANEYGLLVSDICNKDAWDNLSVDDQIKLNECLDGRGMLQAVIYILNEYRDAYLKTKDKRFWWQMIQLLPSSYNQRATLMLNYEVLANMYHARKNHKLDEWREFCKWIETLPYAKELIIGQYN